LPEPDTVGAWVRDRARQVGEMAGYQYAERFQRIRYDPTIVFA
jgi:hypothetical protein